MHNQHATSLHKNHVQAAILQGLEGWCIGWVGGGKLVSIALKTSAIDVNSTGPQFLLQLAMPILPIDRIKYPNAPAQSKVSLFFKLVTAMSVQLLVFVPLTRDIASQVWMPHPVVETVVVCTFPKRYKFWYIHSHSCIRQSAGVSNSVSSLCQLCAESISTMSALHVSLHTHQAVMLRTP